MRKKRDTIDRSRGCECDRVLGLSIFDADKALALALTLRDPRGSEWLGCTYLSIANRPRLSNAKLKVGIIVNLTFPDLWHTSFEKALYLKLLYIWGVSFDSRNQFLADD